MNMSIYANKIGVAIAEMARVVFFDEFNGQTESVGEFVIHPEVLKSLRDTIDQTLRQHEETLAKQKEENKRLS